VKILPVAAAALLFVAISGVGQSLNAGAPKAGSLAPALTYTQLLQAPAGTNADWRSLRGKVVVMEFWATWCVPCISEIPVLNRLADSLDPTKVQFIAVDDEDPKVITAFLKKRPISGWVMLDTSGELYKRYGVVQRPTTMVIDTRARVVSATLRPELLQHDKLLALAAGKITGVDGKTDPSVAAALKATMAKEFDEQGGASSDSAKALFEISVTPGDASQRAHAMMFGAGDFNLLNGQMKDLLEFGLDIPESRIETKGTLPEKAYNLHVHASGADEKQLRQAIELALVASTGVKIERKSQLEDVFLIRPVDKSKGMLHADTSQSGGVAFYSKKTEQVRMLSATVSQLAGALESALGSPVVNESEITTQATATIRIPPHEIQAARLALETNLGLTLVAAKRPVQRFTLSAAAESASAAPISATATK
jgi:uncharacterized protein (TIGR03435 family)